MTPLVAFLTLSAAPALAAASGPLAIDGIERVERVPLPHLAEPVSVHVHALDALIVLDAPRNAAALTRALRVAPRALCPDLDETVSGVTLHCRSRRIVARLTRTVGGHVLEISETRGLPWAGDDAPPLVPFRPEELGLGGVCPGSTPAARGECMLARGDRVAAVGIFSQIAGAASEGLPAVRLGDLAFSDGDVLTATSHWSRVRGEPWERLAAARLCELSWTCLATADLGALYATDHVAPSIAGELELRRARSLAFLGRPLQGAELMLEDAAGTSGCGAATALCRDIAGAALADPGPGALDALALWLSVPRGEPGPAAYLPTLAAAAVAEREGAPIFSANLLAATAGQVPLRVLDDHLLRTAELYLAGGDRVRAGVVLDFARARAGARGLRGPRWAAVARAVRPPGEALPANDPARRTAGVRLDDPPLPNRKPARTVAQGATP